MKIKYVGAKQTPKTNHTVVMIGGVYTKCVIGQAIEVSDLDGHTLLANGEFAIYEEEHKKVRKQNTNLEAVGENRVLPNASAVKAE